MNIITNNFFRIALVTACVLAFAAFGNAYVEGWNWSGGDFVFAGILVFGVGSLFELARRHARGNRAYTFASALGLLGAFLLIWVNGAVGIIGDSDINVFYAAVIFTLFIGTIASRLEPEGMAYTLFLAAAVQFLIPVIAYLVRTPDFSPGVAGVFVLNAFWVMVFLGSGILFREARSAGLQA